MIQTMQTVGRCANSRSHALMMCGYLKALGGMPKYYKDDTEAIPQWIVECFGCDQDQIKEAFELTAKI